uniref:Methyltransferase type 12 n=1 Tax=Cyanothece sp. (strain PCC 7425 / ATCC 29141) TaxID=395961 RepID=B8HXX1_CYAP4
MSMKATTYSLYGYGAMINDTIRMNSYAKALEMAVKPGSVVLDIGTGTGIAALLACQFGAQKVYGIDPSEAICVAQKIARANGYADRIEFIQGLSTQISLPEPVDVVVSDLRGILPPLQHHIPSLKDARQRLLKPGGVLIPQQDRLWATVIEASDIYHSYTSPWADQPHGFDMTVVRRFVTNTWTKAKGVEPEMFLVKPQCWGTIDYLTVEKPNISAQLEWKVERAGIAHGLCLWFDTTLIDGVDFSNAPGNPELIYGRAFFPLTNPIVLEQGDTIALKLKATLVEDDYIWSWATKVMSQNQPKAIKANFQQSTFLASPFSTQQLQKLSDHFIPTHNPAAKIDLYVLTLMGNGLTLGAIAQQLVEQFSDRFPNWKTALNYVSELSQRYSI